MVRETAVAGSFYPSDAEELSLLLERLLEKGDGRKMVRGIIVPHAGYIYSGGVAGAVFATVNVPSRVILLGPNHHGVGPNIAVSGAEAWSTPLGDVPVNAELVAEFLNVCPDAVCDNQAHHYEHSLEVMVPFLKKLNPEVEIVPVALRSLTFSDCVTFSRQLAGLIESAKDDVLLLASSDMNHFLPADENEKLDRLAIEAMTAYDPQALYDVVVDRHISMCGFQAAVVIMGAVQLLGGRSCKLIKYAHSGVVNGDNSRVVGYAGLILE